MSHAAPTHGHGDASHHGGMAHHVERVSTYLVIFALLMVLLWATVFAARVDLDHVFNGLNLVVAMFIAAVKAILVVLFFMHVRHTSKLTWVIVSSGFIWLSLLFVFTFSDYLTRFGSASEGTRGLGSDTEAIYNHPGSQGSPGVYEHVNPGGAGVSPPTGIGRASDAPGDYTSGPGKTGGEHK